MKHSEVTAEVQPLQHVALFVREGFVTLNPAQANMILRECQYDRQRESTKVGKDHVITLAELMRRKSWRRGGGIDFARINGRLILVNGYHRMAAQVASAVNVEWTVVIHECRTTEDVRALYYKFDTNIRKRTSGQVLGGVGFAEETGLSKTMATALYGSAPIIATGLISPRGSDSRRLFAQRLVEDRLDIAKEYLPEAAVFEKLLSRSTTTLKRKLLLKGVVAVALVTLRALPDLAEEFWGGVAGNDGLRKGDPRLALVECLLSRALNVGSANASIASAAMAWNAFEAGRTLKEVRLGSKGLIKVRGTRYTVSDV